jgi:hypothetical protein
MNLTLRLCIKCKNKKSPAQFHAGRSECKSCKKQYDKLHKRAKKVGSYTPKPLDVEWVD